MPHIILQELITVTGTNMTTVLFHHLFTVALREEMLVLYLPLANQVLVNQEFRVSPRLC